MDEQLLAIITALARMEATINKLSEHVEKHTADLSEFAERFEEVIERMENERRLDWQNDFN